MLEKKVGTLGRQLEEVEEKVDMQMNTVNNQIKTLTSKVEGMMDSLEKTVSTRAIPKVSGLDVLDNNIFYNLYISETYILYKL